jgi:hypothetical protein
MLATDLVSSFGSHSSTQLISGKMVLLFEYIIATDIKLLK